MSNKLSQAQADEMLARAGRATESDHCVGVHSELAYFDLPALHATATEAMALLAKYEPGMPHDDGPCSMEPHDSERCVCSLAEVRALLSTWRGAGEPNETKEP